MRIDQEGDAEGNYTVLSWQPTPPNLKLRLPSNQENPAYCMLPVGRFYVYYTKNSTVQLVRISDLLQRKKCDDFNFN